MFLIRAPSATGRSRSGRMVHPTAGRPASPPATGAATVPSSSASALLCVGGPGGTSPARAGRLGRQHRSEAQDEAAGGHDRAGRGRQVLGMARSEMGGTADGGRPHGRAARDGGQRDRARLRPGRHRTGCRGWGRRRALPVDRDRAPAAGREAQGAPGRCVAGPGDRGAGAHGRGDRSTMAPARVAAKFTGYRFTSALAQGHRNCFGSPPTISCSVLRAIADRALRPLPPAGTERFVGREQARQCRSGRSRDARRAPRPGGCRHRYSPERPGPEPSRS